MSKIYTRTGDKGTTSLFGGQRVAKNSPRVEAYGTIDELNSVLGLAIAQIQNSIRQMADKIQNDNLKLQNQLIEIQKDLFEIGAYLATPRDTTIDKGKKIRKELTGYLSQRVKKMEKTIDDLTLELAPMKTFILPGGGINGSFLHLARAISRRAERRVVALANQEEVEESLLIYLNRLSDLLFTMARFVNKKEDKEEIKWISGTNIG